MCAARTEEEHTGRASGSAPTALLGLWGAELGTQTDCFTGQTKPAENLTERNARQRYLVGMAVVNFSSSIEIIELT